MDAETKYEMEEVWEDLLDFIEQGRVIPVIGSEILTVEVGGREVSLYRAVAEALLRKHNLSVAGAGAAAADGEPSGNEIILRPYHELNDAVCALASAQPQLDLYAAINRTLRNLLAEQKEPLPALRDLASIGRFDLFATTTADDLLASALDSVRFGGSLQTEQIEFAPGLPSDRVKDIPEIRSSGYTAVFYLFGKACAFPLYAIHDEDVLEFIYTLQAGRGNVPERLFSELRNRSLLLIGCNFADWLNRFFIRLSSSSRLSSSRNKKEFLADREAATDASLTLFLKRFSQSTYVYPGDARAFVAELAKRWNERHPAPSAETPQKEPVEAPAQQPSGTIFLSYSRTDVAAAKKLFAALREIGGDVAWFDKSELRPGDVWEQEVLAAVRRCSLFLPLISANTEQRPEGYFHVEWDEAVNRSRRFLGQKFIVPVVIDADYDGDTLRYKLVHEKFRDYHYGYAPGGEPTEELRNELISQLRELRRGRI